VRHLLCWLVALLAASPIAQAAPRRPAVVVTLVVDQLAAWIVSDRMALLPPTGGFARLRREGTYARAMAMEHAVSDTAPGHAALFTGAPAGRSGVFANEIVVDVAAGSSSNAGEHERASVLRDPAAHVIASDGPREVVSSSLAALKVPTLADALRAAEPQATIVALSLKDRAALFGGGRHPSASIWYDASLGRFVTSSAVAENFPRWALPIVGPDFLRALVPKVWALDGDELAFVRGHAAQKDDNDGEGELPGDRTTFPHALAAALDPGNAFRATPFADDVLLELGLAAVDARNREATMLLAISLSANDYIAHVYGPDSWEAWSELWRLDAALARFFAALDERVGADGWALVLAADHGTTTLPEAAPLFDARPWCKPGAPRDRFARACESAGRVLPEALGEVLRAAAERTLGPGDWIAGVADPYVFLTPAARALDGEKRRALDDALTFALRSTPGVAMVFDTRHRPPAWEKSCPRDDAPASLVCRALPPSVPAELYVVLQPGWFFDPNYIVGKGTSHGSPYFYDRAVPFFARAPGRVAKGRIIEKTISAASYARTAAAVLSIAPPPAASDGVDLTR
jgi:hypothetical protein